MFFRGITSNQWKECYSEGKIDDDETLIRVRYGKTNDCRPCTSPPDFAGKTIDELLASDLLCDASELILFTARQRSCEKVIFSFVSVCHSLCPQEEVSM